MSFQVKIANQTDEFDQIARLNYATFVEEIPQHSENGDRVLVDRFHRENHYFICKDANAIVGMVALRYQRPFSLDAKIPNLDAYVLPGESLCEIRLLAIQPSHRHGRVLALLMREIYSFCLANNFDRCLISGRLQNIPLYEKLGFRAFGAEVGTDQARYQPMAITRATVKKELGLLGGARLNSAPADPQHYFSPGPVALSPKVIEALQIPLYSHRSSFYSRRLRCAKKKLLNLTKARDVEIFLGTGTLANDVVACHIADLGKPGLILANGEFGERLVKQAEAVGLKFQVLSWDWGRAIDLNALKETLLSHPEFGWLWCVHCETSTGQVLPIADIQRICDSLGVYTHWDGISSLGVLPCDWSKARMATSVSGKAVGALTGMAMVFYNPEAVQPESKSVGNIKPRYLDLREYAKNGGVPFSGSSLLLESLVAALQIPYAIRDAERRQFSEWIIPRFTSMSLPLVVDGEDRSPGLITLALPKAISSQALGVSLERQGILCNYGGEYLINRNWLQICFMGEVSMVGLQKLWNIFERQLAAFAHPI